MDKANEQTPFIDRWQIALSAIESHQGPAEMAEFIEAGNMACAHMARLAIFDDQKRQDYLDMRLAIEKERVFTDSNLVEVGTLISEFAAAINARQRSIDAIPVAKTPPPAVADTDATPTNSGIEPYKHPDDYERDKWIYENIDCHSKNDLSQKLKILATEKRWNDIESRNGFKKTADRYATFHRKPIKRFPTRNNNTTR